MDGWAHLSRKEILTWAEVEYDYQAMKDFPEGEYYALENWHAVVPVLVVDSLLQRRFTI